MFTKVTTDDISKEVLLCPDCHKWVHTKPTEGVFNQALRTCDECEDDFFMDMETPPVYPEAE